MKKNNTIKKLVVHSLFTLCFFFLVSVSQAQITKILSNDSTSVGYFGNFVDISGDYAIVAATDGNGVRPDAYIFFRSDSGWVQQARLDIEEIAGRPFYIGVSNVSVGSVAISDNYAIVASRASESNDRTQGVVHVFKRNSKSWELNNTLKSGDYPSPDSYLFGSYINISGDYIVVGGIEHLYIFKLRTNGWYLSQKINISSLKPYDVHQKLSLSDKYISVLADYAFNDIGGIQDAIYMARLEGNRWIEDGLIRIDDYEKEEIVQFAESDGNVVVISIVMDEDCLDGKGCQYLLYSFQKINGVWSKTSKTSINRSDIEGIWSMDIHKDQLIVGGLISVGEYQNRGVVLLYKYYGNTWNKIYTIDAIDGEQGGNWGGNFGRSIAMSERYAIIGDPREGTGQHHQRGAAYVCDVPYLLITGNEDITSNPFNIYPNPNNGTFAVHFENMLLTDNEIIVSDISGRIVKKLLIKKGQQSFKINLSDLNKGLYILHFVDSEKVYSSSIIIE